MSWLIAMSLRNAPPVAVPDARRHLAVWCEPTCEDVGDLREALGAARRLPRRATTSVVTVEVLPAGFLGETEDVGAGSDEVVVVRFAGPVPGASSRVSRVEQRVFDWASGRMVEDLDVGVILEEPPASLESRVHLQWSEDGTRVVTRGLRGIGLHDYTVANVPPELAPEVGTVLVWLAAHELDDPRPYDERTLRVEEIGSTELRDWLAAAVWKSNDLGVIQAGTGEGRVSLRNFVPLEGDPVGPLLEVGFEGEYADPATLASWLDRVYGTGSGWSGSQ
ncbi:MAG TPA: hypothetical protein QGF58_29500 [Myxococcota bacterium]|nr:hypothetical protein [Myxococcota bacterium]